MKFEKGRLTIFGGVNRLGGSYALVGESVALGELMSTRMGGPPELMQFRFAKTLASVDSFHVSGYELELLNAGQVIAEFKTADARF